MALAGAGFTTIAEIVAICRRGDRFFPVLVVWQPFPSSAASVPASAAFDAAPVAVSASPSVACKVILGPLSFAAGGGREPCEHFLRATQRRSFAKAAASSLAVRSSVKVKVGARVSRGLSHSYTGVAVRGIHRLTGFRHLGGEVCRDALCSASGRASWPSRAPRRGIPYVAARRTLDRALARTLTFPRG